VNQCAPAPQARLTTLPPDCYGLPPDGTAQISTSLFFQRDSTLSPSEPYWYSTPPPHLSDPLVRYFTSVASCQRPQFFAPLANLRAFFFLPQRGGSRSLLTPQCASLVNTPSSLHPLTFHALDTSLREERFCPMVSRSFLSHRQRSRSGDLLPFQTYVISVVS